MKLPEHCHWIRLTSFHECTIQKTNNSLRSKINELPHRILHIVHWNWIMHIIYLNFSLAILYVCIEIYMQSEMWSIFSDAYNSYTDSCGDFKIFNNYKIICVSLSWFNVYSCMIIILNIIVLHGKIHWKSRKSGIWTNYCIDNLLLLLCTTHY